MDTVVALRLRWNNARDHQRHLEEEHMSTIGFIGVGEIASAMVEGLHSATESAASGDGYSFFLSPRSTERSAHLAKTIEAAEVCDSNQDVVDRSELIVLAVLPQQAAAVLDELDIPADRTLISAVAGLATDQLAEHLPHSPTIVRIIPLPAVRERKGVTAMYPANQAVEELLDHLGESVTAADETLFSTLSAVTATMSAHFAFQIGRAHVRPVALPLSTAHLAEPLPPSPTLVRIIPLPAVRERKGVTAMYPANQAVEELLDHLGGSVTAADETLFSTLSAVTATMSAHFAFLQSITAWLVDQGWDQADADHFIRGQFVGLGTTLAETDIPIEELVADHETPGGLNEQLNREWMDEANRGRLAAALDAIYARVTGSSD